MMKRSICMFFVLFVHFGKCQEVKNDLSVVPNEHNFDYKHLEKLLQEYVKDRDNFKRLLSKNTKRELTDGPKRCKRQVGTICVTKKDVEELKSRVLVEDTQIDDIRGELKKLQQLVLLIRDQQLILSVLNNIDKNATVAKDVGLNQTKIQEQMKIQLEMLNGTINQNFLREHDDVDNLKKEVKDSLKQNNNKILKELSKQRKDIELLKQMLIKVNTNVTNTGVSANDTKLNVTDSVLSAKPPKLMIGISDDDEEVVDLEELIKSESERDFVQSPKMRESSPTSSVFAKFLKSLDSTEDDEDSEDLQLKVQKLQKQLKRNKKNEQKMLKLLKTMTVMVDGGKETKSDDLEGGNCDDKESRGFESDSVESELINLQKAIDQLRPKEEPGVDQIRNFQNALNRLLVEQKQQQVPPTKQINQTNIEGVLKKLLPTIIKEVNQNNHGYQPVLKPPKYPQNSFYRPYFIPAPTFPEAAPVESYEITPETPEREYVVDYDYDTAPVEPNPPLYRQSFFRPPPQFQVRSFEPARVNVGKNQPKFRVDQPKNQHPNTGDVKSAVRQVNNQIDQLHEVINKLDQPKNYNGDQPKKSFNHFSEDVKVRHRRFLGEDDSNDGIGALFLKQLTDYGDSVETNQHNAPHFENLHQKLLELKKQLDNKVDRINRFGLEPRYSNTDLDNPTKTILDLKKSKKLDIFAKIVDLIADKILVATPILMKKLFGLSFDDDSYSGDYGGAPYDYGLSKMFKTLGLFGYLPLAVMKFLRVFSYVIGALRQNKFFRDFLVPILIVGGVAAAIVFLVWWLSGDGADKQNGYGGGYDKNYYGFDQNYYSNRYK